MKKQLLTKTLLMAVMLLGGANFAWAQTTSWTHSAGTYTGGQELSSNTAIVSVKLGNSGTASWSRHATYGVWIQNGDYRTPTFTDGLPTAGGYIVVKPTRTLKFSLETYCAYNNCNFVMIESSNPSKELKNFRQRRGQTNDFGTLEAGKTYYIYGRSFSGTSATDYVSYKSFTATTYEDYTIHYVDDSATPVTIKSDVVRAGLCGESVTATEDDMATVEYNDKTYSYKSGNEILTLTTGSNEITLVYEIASVCNYTIKYQDDSATPVTIKDDVEIESYIGANVTASGENFPTYITYNTVRYKYVSGNDELEVTGNALTDVITLTYTRCSTFSYTVKGYDGLENLITPTPIASGSYIEGDDAITKFYPRYVLFNNKLYCSGTGTIAYKTTFTPDEDNYVKKITYNTGTPIANVVFYTEGEDVTGVSKGTNADRASMGKMGYTGGADTYKDVTTLAPGKYILYSRFQNGNSTARAYKFRVGEEVVHSGSAEKGTNTDTNSSVFTVSTLSTLSFASDGSENGGVDYFYLVKTADFATIGAKNYTTFASAYPLDCSDLPDGLTAYYVEAEKIDKSNSVVKLTAATEAVAAGTGLLLKGDANEDYYIPVAATSGTDLSSTNKMIGCTTATTLTSTSPNVSNFYVLVNGATAPEFQNIAAYVASNNVTIPAGKAYLDATGVETSRLSIVFDDNETTGIRLTENSELRTENVVYDLQGRRVMNVQKGLYIVNGKKVVIK